MSAPAGWSNRRPGVRRCQSAQHPRLEFGSPDCHHLRSAVNQVTRQNVEPGWAGRKHSRLACEQDRHQPRLILLRFLEIEISASGVDARSQFAEIARQRRTPSRARSTDRPSRRRTQAAPRHHLDRRTPTRRCRNRRVVRARGPGRERPGSPSEDFLTGATRRLSDRGFAEVCHARPTGLTASVP